jgi:hypothetical protein
MLSTERLTAYPTPRFRVSEHSLVKNNMCRVNCVELNFTQTRWHDAEGPEGKVSRHAGCPATQGWTLPILEAGQHERGRSDSN